MPQAISYTRFSSASQGKGSSTERQKELIAGWLAENPLYELSPLSEDDYGRSGYRGDQLKHGLGSILDAIKANKIHPGDVLLIEALDRLGRQPPIEMLAVIIKILNAEVSIITLEDEQTYSKKAATGNMNSLWILLGKVEQAHDYSERLSQRIKASYRSKKQRAKDGLPIRIANAMWLNTDGSIRPEEASAVLYCIEQYLKGYGARRILLEGRDTHPALKEVHPTTLKRWFSSRALIGEWQDTKPFTPLIESSVYYQLQQQLQKRRKEMSPEQTYSLSGLVVCAVCTARYYYRRKEHPSGTIIYGNCSTYLKRGRPYCTNNKAIPYEVLVYAFERTNMSHIWEATLAKSADKTSDRIAEIEFELQRTIKKIEVLIDISIQIANQTEVITKIAELDIQKRNMQVQLFSLKSGAVKFKNNYSIIDFVKQTEDDMESSELIWSKRKQLLSDPILLRESLKDTDYQLRVKGSEILAPDSSSITIIKRSQKYRCYIVLCKINDTADTTSWAAISRNERAIEASTEAELFEALSNQK